MVKRRWPARLVVPVGNLFENSGEFTIEIGGRMAQSGSLDNECGETIQNTGFWTLRDGALLTNAATGTIVNDNQLHLSVGSFTNDGPYTTNSTTSIGLGQVLLNNGTLTNSTSTGNISTFASFPGTSVLQVDGTYVNNGTVTHRNQITNNGSILDNAVIGPENFTGQLHNYGTFTNSVTGEFDGGLNNFSAGLVENDGHFELNRSDNTNAGFIDNRTGATVKIDNVLVNVAGGERGYHLRQRLRRALILVRRTGPRSSPVLRSSV